MLKDQPAISAPNECSRLRMVSRLPSDDYSTYNNSIKDEQNNALYIGMRYMWNVWTVVLECIVKCKIQIESDNEIKYEISIIVARVHSLELHHTQNRAKAPVHHYPFSENVNKLQYHQINP